MTKLVFEYDFEYAPDLASFHAFMVGLKIHFPFVHHPKIASRGTFKGFPNGVVVFCRRNPPSDTSEDGVFAPARGNVAVRRAPPSAKLKVMVPKGKARLTGTGTSDSPSSSSISKSFEVVGVQGRPKRQCTEFGLELNQTKALCGKADFRETKKLANAKVGALDLEDQIDF